MRLAFSVAVHTDADVLLVDEALAVGDESFREKCFDCMDRFKRQGRTIIFVSHEMHDVLRVADRVVWLDGGRIREDGRPEAVVQSYLDASHAIEPATTPPR
jgi:ABC-type polysaccharide/polyol phosphate transport system ATPase subunit